MLGPVRGAVRSQRDPQGFECPRTGNPPGNSIRPGAVQHPAMVMPMGLEQGAGLQMNRQCSFPTSRPQPASSPPVGPNGSSTPQTSSPLGPTIPTRHVDLIPQPHSKGKGVQRFGFVVFPKVPAARTCLGGGDHRSTAKTRRFTCIAEASCRGSSSAKRKGQGTKTRPHQCLDCPVAGKLDQATAFVWASGKITCPSFVCIV
mmetsp:Transcript_58319/g.104097  ORF Transcript_58319/g.104097 Transcript_58319/m.104097 type:complete len:202 (-) Transcript_58319:83-688(-)